MEQTVIGDPYFYQTKKEIENWLKDMGISDFKINDDLTVDVDGSVFIENVNLSKIPIKFNKVKSYFWINDNKLTSLKGCPDEAGDFNCYNNQITSLQYCPQKVGGDFHCSYNQITSLKYAPKIINGYLNCSYNKLTSLEYCPKIINGDFNCCNNKLKSLKYFPIVADETSISDNPIENLKNLENLSKNLLIELILYYPKLDWKEIEWDKVKNLDEIINGLYENIENKNSIDEIDTPHD